MNLIWFRNDLRIRDNPALWHGADSGPVAGVFLLCPGQWQSHGMAPCRVDFILRNLIELRAALHKLNIPLLVIDGDYFAAVPGLLGELCTRLGVTKLYWNDEYPLDEARRDEAVAEQLGGRGIACHRYHDRVLAPPGSVVKADGTPYQIFTPFKRAWLSLLELGMPDLLPVPKRQQPLQHPALNVPGDIPASLPGFDSAKPGALWPAGEAEGSRRLSDFCAQRLVDYHWRRDLPAGTGTSTLSPWLAAGVISPQQCLHAAMMARAGDKAMAEGADCWISELVWRDFYQHLMVAHPRLSKGEPFQTATSAIPWRCDEAGFAAWCEGRTGIPLVDAGMRQLRETGWMHNRVRMVTAMFLTKNLLVDWRRGERFFMTHLVDGDFAANNGGWQWSASTGTDAAPYFRIFNPFSQAQRFDPDAAYIHRYVPELRGLSAKVIHNPAKLAGEKPGDYPDPIVDLKVSRQTAIDTFRAAADSVN